MTLTRANYIFLGLSICFLLILGKQKKYLSQLKVEPNHERIEKKQSHKYAAKKIYTTAKSVFEEFSDEESIKMKWTPSTEECKPVGKGTHFFLCLLLRSGRAAKYLVNTVFSNV